MPHTNSNANVHKKAELMKLSSTITQLIVDCDCCNDKGLKKLAFSKWPLLSVIEIGSHCFQCVEETELIGLCNLERVVIGEKCFTDATSSVKLNRQFLLKDCPLIRELKIGSNSFSVYLSFVLGNLPSLEVIEMGELNRSSNNFYYASLQLKGGARAVVVISRYPKTEIPSDWAVCILGVFSRHVGE